MHGCSAVQGECWLTATEATKAQPCVGGCRSFAIEQGGQARRLIEAVEQLEQGHSDHRVLGAALAAALVVAAVALVATHRSRRAASAVLVDSQMRDLLI